MWGRLLVAVVHKPSAAQDMLQSDKIPSAEGKEDDEPCDDASLAFKLLASDPFFVEELPLELR